MKIINSAILKIQDANNPISGSVPYLRVSVEVNGGNLSTAPGATTLYLADHTSTVKAALKEAFRTFDEFYKGDFGHAIKLDAGLIQTALLAVKGVGGEFSAYLVLGGEAISVGSRIATS